VKRTALPEQYAPKCSFLGAVHRPRKGRPPLAVAKGVTMRFKSILLAFSTLIIAGCASTDDNLQRASAIAIGHNVDPGTVTVSDIDRGATSVKWTAVTPSGRYACSADDMVRQPYCVKK